MKKAPVLLILSLVYGLLLLPATASYAQSDTVSGQFRREVKKIAVPVEKGDGFLGRLLYMISPRKYTLKDSVIFVQIGTETDDTTRTPGSLAQEQEQMLEQGQLSEEKWTQLNQIDVSNQVPQHPNYQLNKKVYGYHPFWLGEAYLNYDFDLLSRVAYFSFPVNPQTGGFRTTQTWNTTSLVPLAHQHNCRVDMCITNFGAENNIAFLSNLQAQNQLIDSVIMLLQAGGADGVNINFEQIPGAYRSNFANFIFNLNQKLEPLNPQEYGGLDPAYHISVTIPAVDWRYAYDVEGLLQVTDLFILMGYDFYGEKSVVAGPNALMFSGSHWSDANLNNAVTYYLDAGIPPRQLLLGLPYYGKVWETEDGSVPSKVVEYRGTKTFREIAREYATKYNRNFDMASMSSYYIFREDDKWIQCWTDDELSLSQKYDYINGKGLGGAAIWALGFDNGHSELWDLLAQKFAEKPLTDSLPPDSLMSASRQFLENSYATGAIQDVSQNDVNFAEEFSVSFDKYLRVVSLALLLVVFFVVVGFVIAISDFNVRDVLFSSEVKVYLFFLLLLILLIVLLRLFGVLVNRDMVLIGGIAGGVFATLIVLRMFRMKRNSGYTQKP